MELFICVLSDPNQVDDLLSAFLEIGISGATVIDSYGMGQVLLQDIPIFAGFRSLLAGSGSYNKTVFSIIRDQQKVEQAFLAVERVCGRLNEPGKGIAFTLPVLRVVGLRPEDNG